MRVKSFCACLLADHFCAIHQDEANLLLLACRNSHANVVHLLLDAGAIVDKVILNILYLEID